MPVECIKSIDKGYNNIPRPDGLSTIIQFPKSTSFGKPTKLDVLWNYNTNKKEGLKAFFLDAVSIFEPHIKNIICFLLSEPSDNQQLNPVKSKEDVHHCIK
ncbi:hypothetical protein HCN44_003356 [Aphidius gifuensis]|uniref:Uncharacterized protein n=1 Tax=Aphidius gifuensis TaxID=684658 RepID=A0A834XY09_APHGI|nr:hypothetical protein HCN44_003356 [Aphidius gifuensis]